MNHFPGRGAMAAALMALQAACYGPTRQYDPRTEFTAAENHTVKVTLKNGAVVRLATPRVVLDSLLTGWNVADGKVVGLPLSDVATVTGRERSAGRSVALAGALVGALVAVILVTGGGGSGASTLVDEDD